MGLDLTNVVTSIETAEEARSLPSGVVVGDRCGGLSFSDAIAAVLESRSTSGWLEIEDEPDTEPWTLIILER